MVSGVGDAPGLAEEAVMVKSVEKLDASEIRGYDFNAGVNYEELFKSYKSTGFQATSLGCAIDEVNRMIEERKKPVTVEMHSDCFSFPAARRKRSCSIFLAYTSNLVSSGIREVIRYLAQYDMIDCLITSAGGIEEDIIKCLAPTYLGDFSLKGAELRARGINRTGNLLVPNANYCKFEDWVMPILDEMLSEQENKGRHWNASDMIHRLGERIKHSDSICYWAWKNQIPIFCPGITDGSLGDMLYFHSYRNPGLIVDVVQDIRRINDVAVQSISTGMIILGGGVVKHHCCNANLMVFNYVPLHLMCFGFLVRSANPSYSYTYFHALQRNGADYAVYVNTGQEFDGSDAGARPDEAVSWGKIKVEAKPVKVYCDASIAFPIIVAETFAKSR